MRRFAHCVLMLALLAPSAAVAVDPAVCQSITDQLVHYERQKQFAEQRNNEMWAERFDLQIDRLRDDLGEKCPHLAQDQTAEQLRELLKLAARAALTYFTLGAF